MRFHSRVILWFLIAGLITITISASATVIRRSSVPPAAEKPAQESGLNERVVAFCRSRLGKKVGSGQCASLTAEALSAVGGETQFKDFPASEDYVWGALICKREVKNGRTILEVTGAGKSADKRRPANLKPGDIIQFRNVVFQGRFERGTYRRMCPHHTAVIETVSQDGLVCKVLEQNASGKLYVIENELRLADLSAGWLRIYRPFEKVRFRR